MALTEWRSTTSDGVLADTPASGFRYKYGMEFALYLSQSPGAMAALAWSAIGAGTPTPGMHTTKIDTTWKVHIEDPNGTTLFAQTVELEFWFVALLMSMMGGVAFSTFTWWLNDTAGTIETTVCNGQELEEGESPQTLTGAEVGYASPAGGADYSTDYAIFMTDWVSPVYYCSLPAGSTFHIDFHNAGYSKLRHSLSSIQTQMLAATGAFRRLPGYGMMVGARSAGDGMEAHAWHAPLGEPPDLSWDSPVWSSALEGGAGRAAWVPYPGGGRVALVWEALGSIRYAESDNLAADTGWEGPVTVLAGHTLLGADRDTDGTLYLLTKNEDGQVVGYQVSRAVNREDLVRTGPAIPCVMRTTGEPLSLTSVDYFEVDGGVCHVVVDRGDGLDYYQGLSGMSMWLKHHDEEGESGG